MHVLFRYIQFRFIGGSLLFISSFDVHFFYKLAFKKLLKYTQLDQLCELSQKSTFSETIVLFWI